MADEKNKNKEVAQNESEEKIPRIGGGSGR